MHVVITGASAGIGEALARAWAARGASLTLVARRKDRLDKIAAEVGGKTFVHAADLSIVEQATEWIGPAEEALGPIDVLVNNAGVQHIEATELSVPEDGERLLRLNVFTPMRLTRAVLPGMLARRRGTIVDISSMAALAPMPGMFYYNAAKGGIGNASEGLRGELLGTGVHVVTVYPGPVDTDMSRAGYEKYEPTLAARLSPEGTTDGLAKLILKAVDRRRARVIYPRTYAIALSFPRLARWFTGRFSPPVKRLPG
ncbi:Putative short-chain dehydrogenase [Minicystis rosea]|nr:Putative short-chain dehydrogenase [Minicystis rosea]